MGGIGTAICRKLYTLDYVVIAGCGPNRDFTSWLARQRDDGMIFSTALEMCQIGSQQKLHSNMYEIL